MAIPENLYNYKIWLLQPGDMAGTTANEEKSSYWAEKRDDSGHEGLP